MSSDSASALRRKVGGTKGGFFGESVDVKGKYVDKGYVSSSQADIPYLPFLIAVGACRPGAAWSRGSGASARADARRRAVLGIVAATVVVVARTG